jgi:hypothetical protein
VFGRWQVKQFVLAADGDAPWTKLSIVAFERWFVPTSLKPAGMAAFVAWKEEADIRTGYLQRVSL